MQDGFSRKIDYMRISVTDRCNLRCIYCMPKDGIEMAGHQDILRYDEILRICRIGVSLGITKIKLTGGEPLVRKDLPALAGQIKKINGIKKVTLTTNGVLLAEMMEELVENRIDGINISLDTLDQETYGQITRFDMLGRVWRSIQKALDDESIPIKINCVPMDMPGQNLLDVAALAREYPVHVRFIEMMPIGYGKDFACIEEETLKERLTTAFGPLVPYQASLGNGPCRYYQLDGFKGNIGFISAMSHQFCESCNRVRLTSQGFLKTCLQYETGRDLRGLLRSSADDQEIRAAMEACISEKPKSHVFGTGRFEGRQENRLIMSKIGG